LFIAPYNMASESAKVLANRLGVLRVNGSKSFKRSDVVLNWGNGNLTIRGSDNVLNAPMAVSWASNKLNTFSRLDHTNIPTVEHTTSAEEASGWLDQGDTVMARKIVNGSQGAGLCVLSGTQWEDAPLYTKYVKAHEYRVHVFCGKVIDIQKKKRRANAPEGAPHPYIKNSKNGWVFCREDVAAPLALYDIAKNAVEALGLHFGAVDILYRESENKVMVLEINTAPGIENTTLERYVNAIKELL